MGVMHPVQEHMEDSVRSYLKMVKKVSYVFLFVNPRYEQTRDRWVDIEAN